MIPASVEKIYSDAFTACGKLEKITIDPANKVYTSKDNIVYTKDMKTLAFCAQGLTGTVNIPSGVTTIADRAFFSCNITGVTIPKTLETIGVDAFCRSKIVSVNIPGNVKTIKEDAFYLCSDLKSVTLNDGMHRYFLLTQQSCQMKHRQKLSVSAQRK